MKSPLAFLLRRWMPHPRIPTLLIPARRRDAAFAERGLSAAGGSDLSAVIKLLFKCMSQFTPAEKHCLSHGLSKGEAGHGQSCPELQLVWVASDGLANKCSPPPAYVGNKKFVRVAAMQQGGGRALLATWVGEKVSNYQWAHGCWFYLHLNKRDFPALKIQRRGKWKWFHPRDHLALWRGLADLTCPPCPATAVLRDLGQATFPPCHFSPTSSGIV